MVRLDPLERLRRIQFFWGILGRGECTLPTEDLLTLFESAARFGGTTVDALLTEEEIAVARRGGDREGPVGCCWWRAPGAGGGHGCEDPRQIPTLAPSAARARAASPA